MAGDKIFKLYLNLLKRYGSPEKYWPQWCKREKSQRDREIIALGAFLTQRTSWRNAQMALENLQNSNLLSFNKILKLGGPEKLIELIRVAGFFNTKPKRIWEFCRTIIGDFGTIRAFGEFAMTDLHRAREKLLSLYGIGPETADTILLYVLDEPSFIVDEYTKRLVKKEKLADKFDYDFLKDLFEKSLPTDVRIYQDFHALIIFNQKEKSGWGMKDI